MSHYFFHNGFDFLSNDGNFGFYIEQGNGKTSSNASVTEEYVIEVHYLGDAVTSLNLDVTQIDHAGTLDDVYYVSKGMVGANGTEDTDGFRYGTDGAIGYSLNSDINPPTGSSDTSEIVQNGASTSERYWQVQQGGLDPIYGLIEIKIPNDGPTEANGNRDHDYLYLEAGLYFDIIQQDSDLVDDLQDLIDGDITIAQFASELNTATNSIPELVVDGAAIAGGSNLTDASNDVSVNMFIPFGATEGFANGLKLNEVPHMIHFDNVNYYAYDDFSAPVQLNTGNQITTPTETALIGEFRIDENAPDAWSFDAEMSVWLNTNDRSGQYHDVLIPNDNMSYMNSSSSYMDSSSSYMDSSSSYMDSSSSYMDSSSSYMDSSSSYMDSSSSYMDSSMSYMDSSSSYMDSSSSYMDSSSSYMESSSS